MRLPRPTLTATAMTVATLALVVIAAGFVYDTVQSEMQRRVFMQLAQSGPSDDLLAPTIELDELPVVEEVTASAVGDETATVHLSPGIWVATLAINTEDYDGVQIEAVDGFGRIWWSGHQHAFVVGTEHPRSMDAGAVRVTTKALPGYEWTVTFTRRAAQ